METDLAHHIEILGGDRLTARVKSGQIGVSHETHEEVLDVALDHEDRVLGQREPHARFLVILKKLANKTIERSATDDEGRALLRAADTAKCLGSRAETMGLLTLTACSRCAPLLFRVLLADLHGNGLSQKFSAALNGSLVNETTLIVESYNTNLVEEPFELHLEVGTNFLGNLCTDALDTTTVGQVVNITRSDALDVVTKNHLATR